jgi:hypothetical protein
MNFQVLTMGNYDNELVTGNNHIFEKLDEDLTFLKESFLKEFIEFSPSYDPFFLYPLGKMKLFEVKRRALPCIKRLLQLPLSLSYRMTKCQEQLI